MNDATCVDEVDGYTCNCTGGGCTVLLRVTPTSYMYQSHSSIRDAAVFSGWEGTECELDIDECNFTEPCVNGECENLDGSFRCNCDAGYTGAYMSPHYRTIDATRQNNYTHMYLFLGELCDSDIDECELGFCVNGNCTNLNGSFECVCDLGFEGTNCSEANCRLNNHKPARTALNENTIVTSYNVLVSV